MLATRGKAPGSCLPLDWQRKHFVCILDNQIMADDVDFDLGADEERQDRLAQERRRKRQAILAKHASATAPIADVQAASPSSLLAQPPAQTIVQGHEKPDLRAGLADPTDAVLVRSQPPATLVDRKRTRDFDGDDRIPAVRGELVEADV